MANEQRSKRVLIVDDSPSIRRMVRSSLTGLERVELEEASNGLEAIEKVSLSAVDLIVLDMNMPDMHGLEVIRFLRAQRAYAGIPILVLTTRDDEALRRDALAAGANQYMSKPFEPAVLAGRAAQMLRAQEEPNV